MTTTSSPNFSANRTVSVLCARTFVVHFVKFAFDFNANTQEMVSMFPNISCFLFTEINFCSVVLERGSFTFFFFFEMINREE